MTPAPLGTITSTNSFLIQTKDSKLSGALKPFVRSTSPTWMKVFPFASLGARLRTFFSNAAFDMAFEKHRVTLLELSVQGVV